MQALSNFIDATLAITDRQLLSSHYDEQWRSACEIHQEEGETFWRPISQSQPVDFNRLSNALEFDIHPDIQAYYGSYWSGSLEADSEEGQVSLIQLWNEDDFERLLANLIGHALVKYRAKQPFSVFFATTEPESEYFLSIDNETGAIFLEEPGKPPLKEVESDINTFLQRLEPKLRPPSIY
jgi:SecY interacting protein Syd